MINVTMIQIELMNKLVKNEVVSLRSLTSFLECSARKCQLEIKNLNDFFLANKITVRIVNSRNNGYSLEYQDAQSQERLAAFLSLLLEQSFMRQMAKNPRVVSIARELLLSDDYIKAEDLARKNFVSLGTLTADLRIVRSILDLYQIKIDSIPYYGLILSGSKMAQLSALLDLNNWQDVKINEVDENPFLNYSSIDQDQKIEYYRETLLQTLWKHDYKLTTTGFRRIVLLLKELENPKFRELGLEAEDTPIETAITIELLNQLTYETNAQTQYCLSYYLLANMDTENSIESENYQDLYKQAETEFEYLQKRLSNEINLVLSDSPASQRRVVLFILKYRLRHKFMIYEYSTLTSLIDVIRNLPATQSLVAKIMSVLQVKPSSYLNDAMVYELAIIIYNYAYLTASEYEPTNILIVNDFSSYANRSVIKHLNIDRFDLNFNLISSYEYATMDLSDYDAVISTSQLYSRPDSTIPIFRADYMTPSTISNAFWSEFLMKKRKTYFSLGKPEEKHVYELNDIKGNVEERIFEILKQQVSIPDCESQLQLILKQQAGWSLLETRKICLFSSEVEETLDFEFHFEKPQKIGQDQIKLIKLLIINPHRKMLSVKQIDSSIKRI